MKDNIKFGKLGLQFTTKVCKKISKKEFFSDFTKKLNFPGISGNESAMPGNENKSGNWTL